MTQHESIYIWVSGAHNVILIKADILVNTCECVGLFQFDLHFHSEISNQSIKVKLATLVEGNLTAPFR